MRKKQLPLGTSDFKTVIERDYYYVDKTALIAEIIRGSAVTLLPRPRRFGKTLNMSMLNYFFSNADDYRALFAGLGISHDAEAMAHSGQYPVIFLSFKDVKETLAEDVFKRISRLIQDIYAAHSYLAETIEPEEANYFQRIKQGSRDKVELAESIKRLSQFLHSYHHQPVVIIIDEYDMPINSAYSHGYYDELVGFLRNLLSGAFKDNPSVFKGILTGILRIARESIFSGLNNIDVATLTSPRYNQHFGFTETETEQLLQDYELAYEVDAIRQWYNGYNFGGVTIYNPWSIISLAVNHGELAPYWLNTSDNALVRDLIAQAPYEVKQELESLLSVPGAVVRKPLNEHTVFRDIHMSDDAVWNFLLFSGYLAYKNKTLEGKHLHADFCIPNMEVASFYETAILEWFKQGITRPHQLSSILEALVTEQFDYFCDSFEQFVTDTFSYFDITGSSPESFYHAFVLGMLVQLQQTHSIKSNRESGFGRYDVCLIPHTKTKPAFVFEFKKASTRRNETLEQACAAALKQIEANQYVAELKASGFTTVYPIAIAFSGKKTLVTLGEPSR